MESLLYVRSEEVFVVQCHNFWNMQELEELLEQILQHSVLSYQPPESYDIRSEVLLFPHKINS